MTWTKVIRDDGQGYDLTSGRWTIKREEVRDVVRRRPRLWWTLLRDGQFATSSDRLRDCQKAAERVETGRTF